FGGAFRIAVAAVLYVEREAARGAQAENRRRVEGQHQGFLDVRGLHEELADQLRGGDGALVPVLLRNEDRRRVVAIAAADEIEPGERDRVFVGGGGPDRLDHF